MGGREIDLYARLAGTLTALVELTVHCHKRRGISKLAEELKVFQKGYHPWGLLKFMWKGVSLFDGWNNLVSRKKETRNFTYLLTCLFTYSLYETESFLRN